MNPVFKKVMTLSVSILAVSVLSSCGKEKFATDLNAIVDNVAPVGQAYSLSNLKNLAPEKRNAILAPYWRSCPVPLPPEPLPPIEKQPESTEVTGSDPQPVPDPMPFDCLQVCKIYCKLPVTNNIQGGALPPQYCEVDTNTGNIVSGGEGSSSSGVISVNSSTVAKIIDGSNADDSGDYYIGKCPTIVPPTPGPVPLPPETFPPNSDPQPMPPVQVNNL